MRTQLKVKIIALASLLFSQLLAFGQVKAKFYIKFSEPLAIYAFVQRLSDRFPPNDFRTAFEQSAYNNDRHHALIRRFNDLQIEYTYPYSSFPYGQKVPGMTSSLLKHTLIESLTLEDFMQKSIGIVPNAELMALTSILSEFKTVYREVIYKKLGPGFEDQLRKLQDYASSNHLEDHFANGLSFYGSQWDNAVPFQVAVFPSPTPEGFSAEAFLNNAACELPTGYQQYDVLFSVLLHEVYHIFYDEQSLSLKQDFKKWFATNPSKVSQYALLLLNEVLATASGNGYVYEKLNRALDPKDWYNVKYIHLMARQIFPLVKSYMDQRKPMDKAFVDEYIRGYDANFSGWVNELELLMTYRYIITDDKNDLAFFRQNYPYASFYHAMIPVSLASMESMKEVPITKVIVLSSGVDEHIAHLRQVFPELKDDRIGNGKDFVFVKMLKDKTQLIVIGKGSRSLERIFQEEFKEGKIGK